MKNAKNFYDAQYDRGYADNGIPEKHGHFHALKLFVEQYGLRDKKCLEVGCGRGYFQDFVHDYTGLDIAESVGKFLHKPFVAGSASRLCFRDEAFDAIWSITVLEHVAEPEQALREFCRVLKPGGLLFLAPAWQCRPWAGEGYPVRPYSDFNFKGRLVKGTIWIRNSVAFRSLYIFPARLARLLGSKLGKSDATLRFRRLKANYETYWMVDSDACCSIDPYEVIHWFHGRGHQCLNYTGGIGRFLVRTGPVIFRINK